MENFSASIRLSEIQQSLNAKKDQRNAFGKYNYRTAEGILASVKELINSGEVLRITDRIDLIGDRYYVISTAEIMIGDTCFSAEAYAREPVSRKGMDDAQVTGASSSYARKYALCGLFAIDDSDRDPDATNKHIDYKTLLQQAYLKFPIGKTGFEEVIGMSPADLKSKSNSELEEIYSAVELFIQNNG